ncbi:hypothetical protein OESDEN_01812 [Oesophagostomum dentatum]|uniref:aECM cysteine-cradle domain-containing protein n=1 Tax=Oesophagostomum dentatum TaxID=61180 RepID=A0A0B1TQX9_OESDE|nr:hypothetical protein OESDEN_01812 [Oesophagostomum dentatum]
MAKAYIYAALIMGLACLIEQIIEEEKHKTHPSSETAKPEVVYNTSVGTGYSQEDLLRLCEETKNVGAKFGIYNLSSFAGSNCALIRLYYPDVTCEQINVFLEYCQSVGST